MENFKLAAEFKGFSYRDTQIAIFPVTVLLYLLYHLSVPSFTSPSYIFIYLKEDVDINILLPQRL